MLLVLTVPGTAHAVEITQLSGTVALNGGAAPSGQSITVQSEEGDVCGDTPIGDGGSYSLELRALCMPGEIVQFFLGDSETGLLATEQIVLEGGAQQVDISFATNGVVQQTDQVGDIEEKRAESLIEHPYVFWLLLAVIVGAVLLLATMVRSYRALSGPQREGDYRRQVEGLVLLMVVVSITILGVTGKITPEGLTAVLGAITGYAIGQARGSTGQEVAAAPGAPVPGPVEQSLEVESATPQESATRPDSPDEPDVPSRDEGAVGDPST